MTDCTVENDGSAFDDFRDHVDVVIREQDANALAERPRLATDGNEMTVIADANGNIARKAQDTVRA